MDQDLFEAYTANFIQMTQTAKGVSAFQLMRRLQMLGEDVESAAFASRLATGRLDAALFLKCLVALEVEQLDIRSVGRFVEALSCSYCSTTKRLPRLPVVGDCASDEPIPF